MEFLWLMILVPLIYLPLIAGIALIAALIAGKKGKRGKTFRDVFGTFFWELLNPLNWLG